MQKITLQCNVPDCNRSRTSESPCTETRTVTCPYIQRETAVSGWSGQRPLPRFPFILLNKFFPTNNRKVTLRLPPPPTTFRYIFYAPSNTFDALQQEGVVVLPLTPNCRPNKPFLQLNSNYVFTFQGINYGETCNTAHLTLYVQPCPLRNRFSLQSYFNRKKWVATELGLFLPLPTQTVAFFCHLRLDLLFHSN